MYLQYVVITNNLPLYIKILIDLLFIKYLPSVKNEAGLFCIDSYTSR